MNIASIFFITFSSLRDHLFADTKFTHYFISVLLTLTNWTSRFLFTLSYNIWILSRIFTEKCLLLVCLLLIIVLVSFVKSLQPRYKLVSHNIKEKHLISTKNMQKCSRLASKDLFHTSQSGELTLNGVSKVINHLLSEFNQNQKVSLTNSDIQLIYKRLPWSDTQIELESVNWLNRSLLTFWPSIKTIINKFLIENLPTDDRPTIKIKDFAKDQPKLSVYLSCWRKLDLLRKARAIRMKEKSLGYKAVAVISYFVKVSIIYLKQSLMDQISNLVESFSKKPNDVIRDMHTEIDLKEIMQANKVTLKLGKGCNADLTLGESFSTKQRAKPQRRMHSNLTQLRLTPGVLRSTSLTSRLLSPESRVKLRNRRFKLAQMINEAHWTVHGRDTRIELFNLGNSTPIVTGIKYIEKDNNILLSGVHPIGRRIPPSDESNLKLIVELSYCSDKDFCISMSSFPILNRVRLSKLALQLRVMLTINHINIGQSRDLEIFETPDNVLFPIINSAQLALVDVPQFNWHIKRSIVKAKERKRRSTDETATKSRSKKPLTHMLRNCLDPISLINHPFFKYIIHLAIYLLQRWFQPFDILIGEQLHLKTLY